MPTQEQLFQMLQDEKVKTEYFPDLPLSEILPPEDGLEPSPQFIEGVRLDGAIIEPLLLNKLNNRYKIIGGRRRYRTADLLGFPTVPALITRVSPAKRAILTVRLHKLRAENFLADVDALQVLIDKRFTEKQIDELTCLTPQERDRRMRLLHADKRLVEALRANRLSPSLAETIAKLPPRQQAQVLDKLNDKERLVVNDVHEVKEARTRAAVDALPQDLFTRGIDLRTDMNGHAHPAPGLDEPWTEADRLLAALRELQTSGALDFKNNKLSRRAVAEAKKLLSGMGRR